jgi:hypothetical protein
MSRVNKVTSAVQIKVFHSFSPTCEDCLFSFILRYLIVYDTHCILILIAYSYSLVVHLAMLSVGRVSEMRRLQKFWTIFSRSAGKFWVRKYLNAFIG